MFIDYEAIADRAIEIIGSGDVSAVNQAFDVMVGETVSVQKSGTTLVNEADVLSGLGLTDGAALIDKLSNALHPAVVRLLQGTGIDVNDPVTMSGLSSLLSNEVITQSEHDWIDSQRFETTLKWPRLTHGMVQNAIEKRNKGVI